MPPPARPTFVFDTADFAAALFDFRPGSVPAKLWLLHSLTRLPLTTMVSEDRSYFAR